MKECKAYAEIAAKVTDKGANGVHVDIKRIDCSRCEGCFVGRLKDEVVSGTNSGEMCKVEGRQLKEVLDESKLVFLNHLSANELLARFSNKKRG